MLLGGSSAAKLTAEIVPGFEKWSSFHLFFVAGGGTFELHHSGWMACGIPEKDTIVMTGGTGNNHVTRWRPPHRHHNLTNMHQNRIPPLEQPD